MAAVRGFPLPQVDPGPGATPGDAVVVDADGRLTTGPVSGGGGGSSTSLQPVTTNDGTDNALVWADDQLVMVEVPL